MRLSKGLIAVGGVVVAGAAIWAFWLSEQVAFAKVATAYGAKKVCSCLHVSGRDMALCEADFTEDVSLVSFTQTETSVTASVLGGLVSETARHHPGQGCRLEARERRG